MTPIRFHLDESVSDRLAQALRRRDLDVTTSTGAGLAGCSDEEQLEFARRQGRILVTHDVDFLRMHRLGIPHSGIVYSPPGRRSVGEMIRRLLLVSSVLSEDEMRDHLEFL